MQMTTKEIPLAHIPTVSNFLKYMIVHKLESGVRMFAAMAMLLVGMFFISTPAVSAENAPARLLSQDVPGDSPQNQSVAPGSSASSPSASTPVQRAGARSAYAETLKGTTPPATADSKKAKKEAKEAKAAKVKAEKEEKAAKAKAAREAKAAKAAQDKAAADRAKSTKTSTKQKSAPKPRAAAPAPASTPAPVPVATAAMSADDAGPRIRVSQVRFTGNSVYDQQTLAALVTSDLNKDLTFAQLTAMAARVEKHYHANGYQLTRVVLPKQDVRSGAPLEIQVLEGRLGQINVTGNKRYSAKRVQDTATGFIAPGKPFTIAQVERPLVILNQRSGITASSMLKPGAQVGYTDIDIEVKEGRRITGSVETNNFGTEDTGEFGVTAAAALPNLLGMGDELSLFTTIPLDGSDSWQWQAEYAMPVNAIGTTAGAYIGSGKNRAENEYAILDIKGDTFSWGAGATHSFVFNARNILKIQAWFEWQDLKQKMLGFTTSEDKIRKIRAGGDFDRKDSKGRTLISLYFHHGLGEILGGMDSNSVLSSRAYARADNNFAKLTLNAIRMQSFTPRFYAMFNLSSQLSFTPLVSGEQIYLGGANTIRGQPASYYYGDDGYVANAEGRFSILPDTSRWQLAAFIDHGQVHVREPMVGQKKWSSLSGAGIGGRAEIIKNLDARLDLGFPLGAQRGKSCYLYIQARYSF